jgi:hypothetical protein
MGDAVGLERHCRVGEERGDIKSAARERGVRRWQRRVEIVEIVEVRKAKTEG